MHQNLLLGAALLVKRLYFLSERFILVQPAGAFADRLG